MPTDKAGKFHGNIGRAMAADKNAMPAPKPAAPRAPAPPMNAAPGDDGGEAGEHAQAYHGAMGGGKAMLVHHDGINLTAHQVGEDGEVSGPHDIDNLETLKQSMDQFFSEEEQEGALPQY